MKHKELFISTELGEAYELLTHKSGLRVLVCSKDMATTYAMLGVDYGAADMPRRMPRGFPTGQRTPLGIAHFLEHKMFEEPDGTSCDLRFAELGAEVNAYTSYDRTVYYISCTRHFDSALSELFHLVASLYVTRASVSRERSIIAEEIRMNDDSPFERCYAEMLRALYRDHRVREEICGSEASIRRITPRLLQAHFEAFYRPENMVLSVAGRVTAEEVMAVVDACLGDRPTPLMLPGMIEIKEPTLPCQAYTEVRMQVSKPLFCIGVKDNGVPKNPQTLFRRDLCMTLLSEMLFSRSGDFYNDLFEDETITPTYTYGSSIGEGYGYFAISGEGDDPRLVYDRFRKYVDSVKEGGLSQEDLDRSRRILYADYVTGFDATEDIAQALLTYAMDGIDLFSFIPTLTSITLNEITALLETCFVPEQYTLSVVLPLDPADTSCP